MPWMYFWPLFHERARIKRRRGRSSGNCSSIPRAADACVYPARNCAGSDLTDSISASSLRAPARTLSSLLILQVSQFLVRGGGARRTEDHRGPRSSGLGASTSDTVTRTRSFALGFASMNASRRRNVRVIAADCNADVTLATEQVVGRSAFNPASLAEISFDLCV